jgi:hypothetical protein
MTTMISLAKRLTWRISSNRRLFHLRPRLARRLQKKEARKRRRPVLKGMKPRNRIQRKKNASAGRRLLLEWLA